MSTRPGRQTAATAEETRCRIIEAAVQVFANRGFGGASLREIAVRAEVTHGLIRHHFGAKESLWRAVIEFYVNDVGRRHRPLLVRSGVDDPVDLLKGFVRNYIQMSAEYPDFARIIMNDCGAAGPHLDFLYEQIQPLHRAIEPVFLAVQERGLLRDFDSGSFFIFLMSLGSFPFAIGDLSNRFHRRDIGTRAGIERHKKLVTGVLFGEQN